MYEIQFMDDWKIVEDKETDIDNYILVTNNQL